MRFELITPDSIQVRESMGLVKGVYDPLTLIREPLSEYQTMLDLIHRDPTLATAFDIIVDFATYRGFDFIGGTKKQRDELRIIFENLNFKQVLPNLIYSLCYYGDAFLELRKNNSNTPNELWVLETTEMRIIYNEHGKVLGYVQRLFDLNQLSEEQIFEKEKTIIPIEEGGDGKKTYGVFFEVNEVIHFRMKWIGSQVYSYNPNEPIAQVASTRLYAGNYLMNLFMNMPPRYVAHLAGVSPTDYMNAKLEFQSAKTNYTKTIAFSRSSDPTAKLDLKKIDPPYDQTLLDIIKWLNKEMLKLTRVPRIWIEESISENRGTGEVEQRPFDIKIMAIHRNVLEPMLNSKLLKQLGYSKKAKGSTNYVRLKFNEISRKGEKEIIENAGILRDMGLKPEALVSYLDERGILGLDPSDFEKQQLRKNIELNKSRQRMDKDTEDIKSNLEEDGTSEEGGEKIEEQNAS